MSTKSIMIQGTMSSAGKSLLVAGLCRIFKQDGYKVAPFKSQNMALNSYITKEGLEMGRAQVMQAEAAGIKPSVHMNPILLKPTSDMGSQVIVGGEVLGNMPAKDYFAYKKKLLPTIKSSYEKLQEEYDIIIIEGAGSPAEINLKENDIVNMGLAQLVDAPVLLVGDIDRGGVFAQLIGTLILLEEKEQERIKALIINKFRGDKSILMPGIKMLEEKSKKFVAGVVPYMNLTIEDEDSLTEKFKKSQKALIDIAIIRFPRISNFTDFDVFELFDDVSVRYIQSAAELGEPDMIILPGSKNTISDLKWLRESGLEASIKRKSNQCIIFGICGGYQMLGELISDPYSVEEGGTIRGMELLPIETILKTDKIRTQVKGKFNALSGCLAPLCDIDFIGYEIHMGESKNKAKPLCRFTDNNNQNRLDGAFTDNIYGTYVHGIFDNGRIAEIIIKSLADKKGISISEHKHQNYADFKETQYNQLADTLRESLDMDFIYNIMELTVPQNVRRNK